MRRNASRPRSEIARLIDRPRSACPAPRVEAAFVDPHRQAAAAEEAGEQAAGESAADDGHVVADICADSGHVPMTRRSARRRRQQSWYVEYSGAGARRTMSGSRTSTVTPCSNRSRRATSAAPATLPAIRTDT